MTGAIRVGDWKLVINGDKRDTDEESPAAKKKNKKIESKQKLELFNLAEDPSEKKNVADANPEKLDELMKRYQSYASQAVAPKNQNQPRK